MFPIVLLVVLLFSAHHFFLRKHLQALEAFANAGGKKTCMKAKKDQKKVEEATVSNAPQSINVVTDLDKDFPSVYAPQQQINSYVIEGQAQ